MPEGLDTLIKGVGKAVETVPELYEDAFQPAVQESGKLLARIPRAINAAFSGLDKWILNKEYSIEETKKMLAEKLAHVEPEKIVEPDAYVAIPALQAISYSMNNDELRNLYANLLAKAMISDTKDSVHPAFVEIIKQLSPIDAQVFSKIMASRGRPLISIEIALDTGGELPFREYCSWITDFSLSQCCISINNLIRLGLIEIPPLSSYINKDIYDMVKQNPFFIAAVKDCSNSLRTGQSITYKEHFIVHTELSDLFYKVCVQNP